MIGLSDIKESRTYQELVALNSPISNPYVSQPAARRQQGFQPARRLRLRHYRQGHARAPRRIRALLRKRVPEHSAVHGADEQPDRFPDGASASRLPPISSPEPAFRWGNWRYGVDPMPVIPPPSTQLAPGSVGRLMDPNYRNPVTEEFNAGYSWSPTRNSVIEAEYTHVLGLHENKTINIDQKVPVNGACCTRPLDPAFADLHASPNWPASATSSRSAVRIMTASISASASA